MSVRNKKQFHSFCFGLFGLLDSNRCGIPFNIQWRMVQGWISLCNTLRNDLLDSEKITRAADDGFFYCCSSKQA